jgi:nicotinamidase/pyrazinamidase
MTNGTTFEDNDVLIAVDVQNDFCPGGALAVPRGDEIVPIINRLAARFRHVVLTQDWHPRGHLSFASAHPGARPYETISASYGPQVLWPDHCVQDTPGAAFHRALHIPHAGMVIRKGIDRAIDSYSAFYENDRKTPTGLVGYLRERGLTRVFLAGLAFDFCVRYSAEDARREGFAVFVVADACRAIDIDGSEAATHASFGALGIPCLSARWSLPDRAPFRRGAAWRQGGRIFPISFTFYEVTMTWLSLRQCACVRCTKFLDTRPKDARNS